MVNAQEFLLWLGLWLVGLLLVAFGPRKDSGVGLVLAYALQLFVIHFLGSAIYALPWYNAPSPNLVSPSPQAVPWGMLARQAGLQLTPSQQSRLGSSYEHQAKLQPLGPSASPETCRSQPFGQENLAS